MSAIQITSTPQNIIYDKVDDDLRVIIFENKAGAYVVRTTGIVENDEYLLSMLLCPNLELAMKQILQT